MWFELLGKPPGCRKAAGGRWGGGVTAKGKHQVEFIFPFYFMNIKKVRFPRRDFFVNVNENAKFEKQSVKKKVITMKTEFVDILTK